MVKPDPAKAVSLLAVTLHKHVLLVTSINSKMFHIPNSFSFLFFFYQKLRSRIDAEISKLVM